MKMDKQIKKILLFNPFGIGDVLFSTPLIRELNKNYPQANLYYICNKRTKFLLQNNPYLTDVFVYEKDDFRQLWKESVLKCFKRIVKISSKIRTLKIDLMIDMTLNHQASLFMMLSGVKKRIGFNYKKRGIFLTDKIDLTGFDDKNVALYYLDLAKDVRCEFSKWQIGTFFT